MTDFILQKETVFTSNGTHTRNEPNKNVKKKIDKPLALMAKNLSFYFCVMVQYNRIFLYSVTELDNGILFQYDKIIFVQFS